MILNLHNEMFWKFEPAMPTKGQLITLDIGDGSKQYRVLEVEGTVAKLFGMEDISTSQKFNATSTIGTFDNGSTGQLYAGSDLDTYLNTMWYGTLSAAAKAAIVPTAITQYMYRYESTPNTPNTPTYTYQYQFNWSHYSNANRIDSIVVGNRNAFALDLMDIYDYFEKVCISSNELMQLWTNQTSAVNKYVWLRSAATDSSDYVWYLYGYYGFLGRRQVNANNRVRPAFKIDLSKIAWSGGEIKWRIRSIG